MKALYVELKRYKCSCCRAGALPLDHHQPRSEPRERERDRERERKREIERKKKW